MILPHPESDLTMNIMVMGTDIVKQLNGRTNFLLIEKLLQSFLKKDKRRTPDMFMNTLTFLYSVGLVEQKGYRIKLTPKPASSQGKLFGV